jgi:hypothetical protein
MKMTEDAGYYAFDEVQYYDQYVIEPYKNDDPTNGVSTLDLVMIQRHILGLAEFDSPYKLIAADVNGNEAITASDLLLIRKVILGIESDFGDNPSWRFIPTTYEIEDPTHPYGFPEKVLLEDLYISNENIDFTAIKTGDVNGNATTNLKAGKETETRSAPKTLLIDNQTIVTNEMISVPVYANDVTDLLGFQMTLEFGKDVQFKGIKSNRIEISDYNVNAINNTVLLSWNAQEAISLSSDEVLFTVELAGIADGELKSNVAVSSQVMQAELYDNALNVIALDLSIRSRNVEDVDRNVLHQNTPNPFKGMTTINFDLRESGLATIAVFDISGKELYRMTNDFAKGKNALTLDMESLNASSGILYYTLKAGDFIDTKKMILMD